MTKLVRGLLIFTLLTFTPQASAASPSDHIPGHVDIGGSRSESGATIKLLGAETLKEWTAELLNNRGPVLGLSTSLSHRAGAFPAAPIRITCACAPWSSVKVSRQEAKVPPWPCSGAS
jgi:hypothetical protein